MSDYPWASNFLAYAFPCCDCGVCNFAVGSGLTSEAEATALLAARGAACIVYGESTASDPLSHTASLTANLLTYAYQYAQGSGGQAYISFKVYVPAACDITVVTSLTGTSINGSGYDADTAAPITFTGDSSGGVFEFPGAGYYIIQYLLQWNSGGPGGGGTDGVINFEITETDCDLTYCILQASWDDGGGNAGTVICT